MQKTHLITTSTLAIAVCLGGISTTIPIAPTVAMAAEMTSRPADGTTKDQPFAPGTGGSDNFRIPGIVTLDNGNLVAATDARWNHAGDGAGLDTIVSRSSDNGKTWHYTFANYLGDNGNIFNDLSTSFIDPAIATDGKTLYLVADLFPAGIALNTSRYRPQIGEEFDAQGHLKLRSKDLVAFPSPSYANEAAKAAYDYYLDLDSLTIHLAKDDSPVTGYTVDGHFNITDEKSGTTTNLFCADAPFQVFPTDYLYFTSSHDGGKTWSDPTLINIQKSDEQTVLVGPGTGTVLKDGTIVFSAYEYTNGKQASSIIYSRDGGKTWSRSEDVVDTATHWTSEATTVEINDTTIRQFYRDGHSTLFYTDYTKQADGSFKPGNPVDTGVIKTYNNQISALKYSGRIDGHEAIIVSMASVGTNARNNGKLHVGLIQDDGTMEWRYAYTMTKPNEHYGYSSITETKDGDIAVLYESESSQETFTIVPIKDLVNDNTNVNLSHQNVELSIGESRSYIDATGDVTGADTSELDTNVATVQLENAGAGATQALPGSNGSYGSMPAVDLASCGYTFTRNTDGSYTVASQTSDGKTVYLAPSAYSTAGYPNAEQPLNITLSQGKQKDTVYLRDAKGSYLYFDRSSKQLDRVNDLKGNPTWENNCSWTLLRPAKEGESGPLPSYTVVDNMDQVENGTYLIATQANDGTWFVLYPSLSTTSKTDQAAQITKGSEKTTRITFTGRAEGSTAVTIGSVRYHITVVDKSVSLSLKPGETGEITLPGDATGADLTAFDPHVATVKLNLAVDALTGDQASALEDRLYTVDAATDGKDGYQLHAATSDGTNVWLSPSGSNAGYPFATSKTTVTFTKVDDSGHFIIGDGQKDLYFKNAAFDRVNTGTLDGPEKHFMLFTPAKQSNAQRTDAKSAIPGYAKITDSAQLSPGSKVLVAIQEGDQLYLLNPSASQNDKSAHVARLRVQTKAAFTAVGAGTTSAWLGDSFVTVTVSDSTVPPVDPETFTVVFDDMLASTDNLTLHVPEGSTINPADVPDPVCAGYRFDGWYTDAQLTIAFDFSEPVTSDLTVYAKWTKVDDHGSNHPNKPDTKPDSKPNSGGNNKGSLPQTGDITAISGGILSALGSVIAAAGVHLKRKSTR